MLVSFVVLLTVLFYYIISECQGVGLEFFPFFCMGRGRRESNPHFPAPRFAIRSHAAKRVEVNLNPGVAIWFFPSSVPVLYYHYTIIIVIVKGIL